MYVVSRNDSSENPVGNNAFRQSRFPVIDQK